MKIKTLSKTIFQQPALKPLTNLIDMTTPFTVIIPARYHSSRLPGKIIAPIAGKPMVQWVYEKASQSGASRVVIAADHPRIADALQAYGSEVVMTSVDHPSGTDRLEEVARLLNLADDAIVVNVQGDEPLIPPQVIDQVAANLAADGKASVATLCEAITDPDEFLNPNAVKVVADGDGRALYFSRAPIPWPRDALQNNDQLSVADLPEAYRHIGIYAYRVGLLHKFVQWPVAPLEAIEKLEQLRVMYHGASIHVAPAVLTVPAGVDTESDLIRVKQLLGAE